MTHLRTCTCLPCVRRQRLLKKRREANNHRGIPNRLPTTAVIPHIQILRKTMSWVRIGAAAGCSPCHLREIVSGKRTRINRVTYNKIMSVRPAGTIPWGFTDATGSVRRVRALQAIGHTQDAIAAAAGTTQYRVSLLARGRQVTRQLLADKIIHAYRTLAATPGTSTRSRRMAAANGWASPAAWDGPTIDDPRAEPEPEPDDRPAGRSGLGAQRRAEALHLAAGGVPDHAIARRVGLTPGYVHDMLRAGRRAD